MAAVANPTQTDQLVAPHAPATEQAQTGNLDGRAVTQIPAENEANDAQGSHCDPTCVIGTILIIAGVIFALIAAFCLASVFPLALLGGTVGSAAILGAGTIMLLLGITMSYKIFCFGTSEPETPLVNDNN